ncbi:MAG TPA: anti-CBASS Acb1 family protein [Bryobacteraceae bacterium]|jgi:phage-related protein (TIGR01555 family)|nr:anti-CBASS Acb1 family protein [Bryobacteraceae bacterium]
MGKHRSVRKPPAQAAPVPIASSKAFATNDSFSNFMAAVGISQPASNQSATGTYTAEYISRFRPLLDNIYRSSWICGVAVDSVAEDMTKRGIEIVTSADPAQVEGLHAAWRDLHLWDQICDTIKWGRLYGGAIGVMLIDGQRFDTPLRPETVAPGAFKGVYPLDRWTAQPVLSLPVRDYGPDFGKPMYYDVMADNNVLPNARIHYSRVIRIDGIDLPYYQRMTENLWGQSVIERLWDRLLAFDSTTQGAAQLVYKAHLRTYAVENLREIIAAGGPARQGLIAQIDFARMMQSNEGITLMDAKDKFEAHSYTFSGLDTVLLQFGQQLSGALQIPLVRLFGQSPAGLNATGESDIRNYYDGIQQRQEHRLRSPISSLLRVTWRSLYGSDLPEGSNFSFRPLWVMSDEQKAQIGNTITQAVTQAESNGLVRRATALKELRQSSHITGLWSNITDEEIEEAENEPPPVPDGMMLDENGEAKPAASVIGEDDEDDGDSTNDRAYKPRRSWRDRFLALFRDEDWKESEHPRKDDGEFTEKGSGTSGSSEPEPSHPLGPLYREVSGKPHEAIAKLLSEKKGAVPDIWDNPEVPTGKIGLAWGVPGNPAKKWRGGHGLAHIIAKHVEAQQDFKLEDLPDMVPKLKFLRVEGENRLIMETPDHRAVVSLDWYGKQEHWLISAFEPRE